MVDLLAPLALVGLAAFVVVFVRTARKQRRERARLFRELASAHGWRFLETDDGTARALSEGFGEFARFRSASLGERPPMSVVLGEVEEGRVCVFSHATRRDQGDARQWTVCLIEAPTRPAPPMTIRPRSVARAHELGGDPHVPTGDPRFDEALEVRSPEPDAARGRLGPAVRNALLHSRSRRIPFPVGAQTRGRRLAVYPAGRNEGPETVDQLEALVEHGRGIARALNESRE